MGKDSKQRTKGGVQPSSSSRTAKLLEKTGGTVTPPLGGGIANSFLAASAEARGDYYGALGQQQHESPVHSSSLLVVVDDELPPEVKLVFRRLLKKDGITKVKALSELTNLIDPPDAGGGDQAEDEQAVSSAPASSIIVPPTPQELSSTVLPQWARIYPKLTQDDSRKVRELAHTTHGLVCKAVGRNLARYLRNLMPHWYLGQFDVYGPVASAARRSFESIFPTEVKQAEALKYCAAEIQSMLRANFENVWVRGDPNSDADHRVVCATIKSLNEMVRGGLEMDGAFMELLFKRDGGLFWAGVGKWEGMGRKHSLELVATLLASERYGTLPPVPLITSKLLNNVQADTFAGCWNLLCLLCSNSLLGSPVAKQMLLKLTSSCFHHQASQMGPNSIQPVFALAGKGQAQEFAGSFLKALGSALSQEKSGNERTAMVRLLIGVMGEVDDSQLLNFIVANLSVCCVGGLPRLIYDKVEEAWFHRLCSVAESRELLDTNEIGLFFAGVVGGCTGGATRRGAVRFQQVEETQQQQQQQMGQREKELIDEMVKLFVKSKAYVPVAVLSRKLGSVVLERIDLAELDLDSVQNLDVRVQLVIDLIAARKGNPILLGSLSTLLDHLYSENESQFIQALNSVVPFLHIPELSKLFRMDTWRERVKLLVTSQVDNSGTLQTLLNFSDKLGSPELMDAFRATLEQQPDQQRFSDNLARVLLLKHDYSQLVEPLYLVYWDKYLASVVGGHVDELAESVCRRRGNLQFSVIGKKLDAAAAACSRRDVAAVDRVVQVALQAVRQMEDHMSSWLSIPRVSVPPGVLSFLQLSYDVTAGLNGGLEPVHLFSGGLEAIAVVKCLVAGKMALLLGDEIQAAMLHVLYAQALVVVWRWYSITNAGEVCVDGSVCDELKAVSSRLVEQIHDAGQLERLLERVAAERTDALWSSRLPLRLLRSYCSKSELDVSLPGGPQEQSSPTTDQLDSFMEELATGTLDLDNATTWITSLRASDASLFSFDVLYRNIGDIRVASKLALLTLHILSATQDQNHLSTLTCWVASWLKGAVKYVEPTRAWCYWVTVLARCVVVIGERAREQGLPQFNVEYVEFLSGQLYGDVYRGFVELQDYSATTTPTLAWWGTETLSQIGAALAFVPSGVLCAIEPSCMQICDRFAPVVVSGVNLPIRLAAYRVLRKVRYEKDLPIVPPSVDHVIRELAGSLEDQKQPLISYLLLWDALLRIQEKSNEFASYVRDQPHLLPLLLETLFFSPQVEIETALQKHFETEPQLTPGSPINLLHLACSVLHRALRNLPYTIRWWWNNVVTKQRDRVFVEKFVMKHLSSMLAAEELRNAQLVEDDDDNAGGGPGRNVTVHCHSGCNELVAHYRIEETNVTLTISLPLNHPLGPVSVRISDKKLHARISHLLNSRSHSLSAGLKLWKETLDSLYKDVDECSICFFLLHHVTKQLPKLACKTCRKKFHAGCLYKWFSTSNKSECPLCRNLF